MAGHRKQHGRPRRDVTRQRRMEQAVAIASTTQQRAAAAWDALRIAAARSPAGKDALEEVTAYMLGLTHTLTRSDR